MPVREFVDDDGREWRAWDIRPDAIHPLTKSEDYLAACYDVGWIVFETVPGDQKRRLCPYPKRWVEASDADLRALLQAADPVPARKLAKQRSSSMTTPPAPAELIESVVDDKPDVTDLDVVRSFRYPGGRLWTVCVITHPENGGPPVLRFTAGMRSIDANNWPKDWPDAPDTVLIDMLRLAAPRRADVMAAPGTPRRRWNDLPVRATHQPAVQ
jgi:hypothetical protein